MSDNALTDVLWRASRNPKRGPKPQVNRDRIVAGAIRVADSEGIRAASMQRIASEVGVTKMALYRHVPGKPELIALMIEAALGPAPAVARPWREGLRNWADAMRLALTRHQWLSSALTGARLIGPVELGWTEAGLGALSEVPLSASERLDTLVLIGSHVRGIVEQSGFDSADPEQAMGVQLTAILDEHADEFPLSTAAYFETAAAGATDQAYEYGLDRIFAGVSQLVEDR